MYTAGLFFQHGGRHPHTKICDTETGNWDIMLALAGTVFFCLLLLPTIHLLLSAVVPGMPTGRQYVSFKSFLGETFDEYKKPIIQRARRVYHKIEILPRPTCMGRLRSCFQPIYKIGLWTLSSLCDRSGEEIPRDKSRHQKLACVVGCGHIYRPATVQLEACLFRGHPSIEKTTGG